MCGIVGFIGREPAAPLLLDGLAKLEYRGYDSAGVALADGEGIVVHKAKGALQVLSEKIAGGAGLSQHVGIGHTRWATHGKPSDENSHPHLSARGTFAVVHNGIIENYLSLKQELSDQGVVFSSETDSEVIAQLLETYDDGDLLETVRKTVARLRGSYALGILSAHQPEVMIAVRSASPLIVGLAPEGNFIASDIPAILRHTRRYLPLEDGELAILRKDGVSVLDLAGNLVEKEEKTVTWDVSGAEKGGYPHFMIKEIMEQPRALSATISPRIGPDGKIVLDGIRLTQEEVEQIERIYIVACGSAYHAGVVGKYVIEKLARIPVETDLASEFRYRDPLVNDKTLVVVVSQSGETADSLAALREAKRRGARVLGVVNVVGSSVARESDDVLYTWAGPEISVATTKAYSTQLIMMYLLAFYLAEKRHTLEETALRHLLAALVRLPEQVEEILAQAPAIQTLAQRYAYLDHAYYIGRNLDYAVAMEASLKLKEISYIHSEAYAAGELKHGTISLIEEGTFVVALACTEAIREKTLSNILEVKARGAETLAVTTRGHEEIASQVDHVLFVPQTEPELMPSLEVVPMQLLGYYISLARKCDIDKPRNLAKSVTVE